MYTVLSPGLGFFFLNDGEVLLSNESCKAAQMSPRECKFSVGFDNCFNQIILQQYWLIHTLIIYVGAAVQWQFYLF